MLATRLPVPARSAPLSHDLEAPPLTGGARVEVCIAGSGLAGTIAAYLLAHERRAVMLIDEGPIGGVAVGAEVAHLAERLEVPYHQLERLHGERATKLAAQGATAGIDALEAIVRRERIACEFERLDGYAFGLPAEDEARAAHRAGLRDVEALPAPPVDGVGARPCVRYPGQVHFHPLKLAAGVARAAMKEGARIHCGVGTKSIQPGNPATLLTTGSHRIEADVIVSRGADPRVPRVVQVIGLRVPRGAVARALYWDFSGPVRCARLRAHGSGGEVVLVGGEDTPQGLEAWARSMFPRAGDVVQRYTAALPAPADLFAFSGGEAGATSTYVSTSSWGAFTTRAAIAGMVIRDFVEARDVS